MGIVRNGGRKKAERDVVGGVGSAGSRGSLHGASGWGIRVGLVLGLAGFAFVMVSLASFSAKDWPSHTTSAGADGVGVSNLCGAMGAAVAYGLITMVGWGAYVFVGLVGTGLMLLAMGVHVGHVFTRLVGVLILAAAIAGLQRLLFEMSGSFPDLAGGKVGVSAVDAMRTRFGGVGTGIWLILLALLGAVVAWDELVTWVGRVTRSHGVPAAAGTARFAGTVAAPAAWTAAKAGGGLVSRMSAGLFAGKRGEEEVDEEASDFGEVQRRAMERRRKARSAGEVPDAAFPGEGGVVGVSPEYVELDEQARRLGILDPDEESKRNEDLGGGETGEVEGVDGAEVSAGVDEERKEGACATEDELPGAPQVFDRDALREKISRLPVVFGQNSREVATDADLAAMQNAVDEAAAAKPYRFPGMDLLENPEENFNEKLESFVRDQAAELEAAMQEYGIDGEVVGIESGPVITLFDVRLAPGTKVAAVSAVTSDIARSLRAINLRIVPNQVGRDTIGIEVPNAQKEKVRLKELMAKTERFGAMKLPMFLGKDAAGEPLIEDLSKMPHMLIAGTTGSGKSVCMNTIIMGFLYTKKPSELKMVLVDPKMVEMSQFKDIPHLMCPVVTEMGKAAAILEWACTKMDERYELLAEAGCRDIGAYNELEWEELKERLSIATDEEAAKVPRKLPYMVFIIDELADLMMTAKEVESYIIRIAQKARAVGMHLILATQRPQANVVTGLIKSNMPCRVAFRVNSGMDSRIVLDGKGAELLLGYGDMLFLNPRTNKLSRAQGTLVDDKEIRSVVRFMKDVAGPSFERQLLQLRRTSEAGGSSEALSDEDRVLQSKNNSSASLKAAQEDPLFERAVEIVLESRRGSVSLLQRRLAIGYTRSSRLVDLMGIAGIISDHKGSVARDVLITAEEWAMMKDMAKEEARVKGIAWPVKGKEEQGALFNAEEPVRRAEDPAFERTADEDDEEL